MTQVQNLHYFPEEGDIWIYSDLDREGDIQWQIVGIDPDKASITLRKISGKDIGFERVWPMEALKRERWTPKHVSGKSIYLWPCPGCHKDAGVPVGDYICEDCRKGLTA